jgi:hypothetical protein
MVKKPDRSANGLRTAILVLGMHRSGTSALARLTNFLGAALPRHLIPAGPSNPRGHWESKPLVELHDELLAAIDSSWDDWRAPPARWKEGDAAARYASHIRLAIDEEYGNAPLFVLKDPRICRTLPYWMSILEKSGVRSAPLIIVRNPLEVAESLRERDGISFEKAMLLWLRHNLDAEYETRHLQRNIVTFDALLEDWKLMSVQSAARMGITWTRQPPLQDVREFLDSELHNHRSTQAELEAHTEVPYWVKAAYRALALLCDEPKSAEPKRELDRIRTAFAESAKIFGGVAFAQTDALKQAAVDVATADARANARVAGERQQQLARARELELDLSAATARATEYEQVSNDFETALTQARSELKDLTAASQDYRRRADDAEAAVASLTKEVEALRRITTDAAELKALAKHLSDRTEWIEKELKSQHTKTEKMKNELQETRAKSIALSTELQAALSNAMTLTKTATLHETQALKAQAALGAAQEKIAELEADDRRAQTEIAELRAELAESWSIADNIERATASHANIAKLPPAAPALVAKSNAEGKSDAVPARIPASRARRIEDDLQFERVHVQQLERRLTTWMGLASAALRKITRFGGPAKPAPRDRRHRAAMPSAATRT